MEKINSLIKQLTLQEKIELVTGFQSWMTYPVKRLNIPSIYMTDGPIGLRKKSDEDDNGLGLGGSCLATSFPTSVSIANSWNNDNAYKMGKAIGQECEAYDVNIILGPALNIKRDPRCGRNFEYYSEDPLLAGKMAANFTIGIQENNVAACMKHFALNNSENFRYMGSSTIDERAAREIYLKPFEICVKEGKVKTAMCGYNQINNVHCSENKWLLKDVLRNQWGFEGLVMTDWGATKNRVIGVQSGIDLDMPGGLKYNKLELEKAILNNTLSMEDLDECVRNVLRLVYSFKENKKYSEQERNDVLKSHIDLALQIALDSAVLLKNDNKTLPISNDKNVLIVGEMFEKMRYQGAGSSCMNPYHLITPKQAFDNANVKYEYVKGYKEINDTVNENLENEALEKSKDFDTILFFGGLTELFESEGYDRENLSIPNNQIQLINKLAENKNVILVLFGGSAFEMPFVNNVKAILHMFLPGQCGGEATRQLLYGIANPSGKLSETFVKKTSDIYFSNDFSTKYIEEYKENIYVGYRYYDEVKEKILFPFGYGLSYSTFEYNNYKVIQDEKEIKVSLTITNTSEIKGKEIVQVYVGKNDNSKVFKAQKQLKAYAKIELDAHESKDITLSFNISELAYYNTKIQDFVIENGNYPILVGKNSLDVKQVGVVSVSNEKEVDSPYSQKVNDAYNNIKDLSSITSDVFKETINGISVEEPTKHPFTLETSLRDFNSTRSGRFVLKLILKVVAGKTKVNKKEKDETKREQMIKNARFAVVIIPNNCLRSLSQSSGGIFPMNMAKGLLHMANGHFFKGVATILKKEK